MREKRGNKTVWCATSDRDAPAPPDKQQWVSFGLFHGQIWETKATNASVPHVCPIWLLEEPLHISSNARARIWLCVAQNVDMLRFPDGSFSGMQRRIFEQIFRNLPSCRRKCLLAALPRSLRNCSCNHKLVLISTFSPPIPLGLVLIFGHVEAKAPQMLSTWIVSILTGSERNVEMHFCQK